MTTIRKKIMKRFFSLFIALVTFVDYNDNNNHKNKNNNNDDSNNNNHNIEKKNRDFL